MKAIVIKNYGGPEVLQLAEVSTPSITNPSSAGKSKSHICESLGLSDKTGRLCLII